MSNNAARQMTHMVKTQGLIARMRQLCDEMEQELKEAEIARNNDGEHAGAPELQDQR